MINNPHVLVSIDLETLGTTANAAVLSIGAAAVGPDGETHMFSCYCNIESQEGRAISGDTLAWWEKQGALFETTKALCADAESLATALRAFSDWVINTLAPLLGPQGTILPFGNGATFDIGILENAYQQYGMQPPWAFWNVRDLRTIKWLCEMKGEPLKVQRTGTHHEAMNDAWNQLKMIQQGMDILLG